MTISRDAAERIILASCIADPSCAIPTVRAAITPDDLASPGRQAVLHAILSLSEARIVPTAELVSARLLDSPLHGRDPTYDLSVSLERSLLTASAFESDPEQLDAVLAIVQHARARKALMVLGERLTATAMSDEDFDVPALLANAHRELSKLEATQVQDARSMPELVAQCMARLDRPDAAAAFSTTGFEEYDLDFYGVPREGMTIVGARPGSGKTALLGSLAAHFALERGEPTVWISYEDSDENCTFRVLAQRTGVPLSKFVRPAHQRGRIIYLTDAEKDVIHEQAQKLAAAPMTLIYPPQERRNGSISQIEAWIERERRRHGAIQHVVLDYIQRVPMQGYPGGRNDNREQVVAWISDRLLNLCARIGAQLTVGAQLNRESTRRGSFEPRLSDLRESGSLEQDASQVLLLHYERAVAGDDDGPSAREEQWIVAKNRGGPLGTFGKVRFDTSVAAWVPDYSSATYVP